MNQVNSMKNMTLTLRLWSTQVRLYSHRCLKWIKECGTTSCDNLPTTKRIALRSLAMAPKKMTQNLNHKDVAPQTEKYDFTRTQQMNPADPRALGAPCWSEHTPARPGRGSVTGSNRHATWTGCSVCHLRLTYTPAFGSHGLCRQAGPLAKDVETQVAVKKPEKGSCELMDRKIGLDGAERSLVNRLETVRRQKEAWQQVQDKKNLHKNQSSKGSPSGPEASGHPPKASPSTPSPTPASGAGYGSETIDLTMNVTPGRKARKPQETAEDLEYHLRQQQQEAEEWTQVSPPESPP